MNREHALRYLLLRHLKRVEHQVTPALFDEAACSLQVSKDADGYLVRWTGAGTTRTRRFRESDFAFYQRGDTDAALRAVDEDLTTGNDATAQRFALEVFDLPSVEPPEPRMARSHAAWPSLAAHAGVIILLVVFTELSPLVGAIVFAIGAVEYARLGRLYASFLFLPLARVAPGAAAAGAAVYGMLQFLDPDPRLRSVRVAVSLSASVAAAAIKAIHGGDWLQGSVVIAVA